MATNNPDQHTSPPTPRGAAEAAGNRIEHGGRRVEDTIERLEKTAEDAANSAIGRVRAAREQATSGIVEQRDQVAERIQKLGEVLRSGSEYLRRDDPLAHQALIYASDRADGLASYVRSATPGGLAEDLHTFAKRRPGVFFGGAFLLGLAVGRFVKSSTAAAGGGGSGASAGYGDIDVDVDIDDEPPARQVSAAASTRARPAQATPAAAESRYAAPSSGTSLPYVSAGSAIGATPSSATYGVSTVSGTRAGEDSTAPSYGTTTGGTGGYASSSPKPPVVTRPSQPPLREAPDTTPNPKPHAVREGEGTKS
ncbi:MAG: hypothetical protein ABW252_22995 [Polyangiales bacterium]